MEKIFEQFKKNYLKNQEGELSGGFHKYMGIFIKHVIIFAIISLLSWVVYYGLSIEPEYAFTLPYIVLAWVIVTIIYAIIITTILYKSFHRIPMPEKILKDLHLKENGSIDQAHSTGAFCGFFLIFWASLLVIGNFLMVGNPLLAGVTGLIAVLVGLIIYLSTIPKGTRITRNHLVFIKRPFFSTTRVG